MSKKELEVKSAKKGFNRRQFLTGATVGAGALVMSASFKGFAQSSSPSSKAWSFGVMADTQWANLSDDGFDPNTSAIEIATQIQSQFIAAGVDFVIHVGDLEDTTASGAGTTSYPGERTRALFAQNLYNAGIGFYPLRGNHDDGSAIGTEIARIYPQTQTGIHNQTPSDVLNISSYTIPAADLTNLANLGYTPTKTNPNTFRAGTPLGSPSVYNNGLQGLTYAFSFNNATFVLLDQFTPTTSNPTNAYGAYSQANTIAAQQSWISSILQQSNAAGNHSFVFGHKGLITLNHSDVLFSLSANSSSTKTDGSPAANPAFTNAFIDSLYSNNVKMYFHGHDHMYDRSIVLDTNGNDYVTQILCASDSSKFYIPQGALGGGNPQAGGAYGSEPFKGHDDYYNVPAFGIRRRTPISQELRAFSHLL
jgi:hypothetical protein